MPLAKKDFVFVGIQLLLFLTYVLPIQILPSVFFPPLVELLGSILTLVGFVVGLIALLQLKTSLSPFPTPKINGQLIRSGVFALVRHPIYFSILLCASGYALFQSSIYRLMVSLLLLVLFHFKSSYEENLLCKKYSEYKDYQQKVGKLFPKLF